MTEPALLAPVIAHRGASGTAPENTLAAIALAAKQGARCVELDASISKDGIAFVHHDDTLERCTDGAGYLCAHTAAELDKLKATAGLAEFENEPLPRLDAAIALLDSLNMGLNLEIKPTPGLEEPTARAVCDVVREQWRAELPLVLSSFSKDALAVARDELPGAPRGFIVCAIPENWRHTVQLLQCQNLHCDGALLEKAQAQALLDYGLGVYCFTINTVADAQRLFDMHVHGVFTDYPAQILGLEN